jgi:predicted DNA-binding transcriptional regulator AlpA
MTDKLLTRADLAALIGVSVHTIRVGGAGTRTLRRVRLGRTIRYRQEDVERWIQANVREPYRPLDRADRALRPNRFKQAS